jgi:PAS domain S-box-containing protein
VAVRNAAGRIVRVQGASQDIHRSRAEAEALRQTLDSLTDGFATFDREWRVTYANRAAVELMQLSGQDVLGRPLRELLPLGKDSEFDENYRLAIAERKTRRFDAYYEPLGMWIRASAFPSGEGLALSFNDITASRNAQDALERANASLEARLQERNAELKRINDELASFTLSVAHDLRAPLDAISGFSHALAERLERSADAKVTHYLQRIGAGVSRMGHMIEGVVELSRIGRAPMEPRQVDVTAMARDCVEDLRAAAPGPYVDAQVDDGLRAWGDPRLLHTVLHHLLDRAWKCSAQRHAPRLRVGREADGTFFVHDNGAGFDMERAEELFLPFSRLHTDGQFPAQGISLAAARRIVQRHGGRMWAEASPDRGTTFRFTLADPKE